MEVKCLTNGSEKKLQVILKPMGIKIQHSKTYKIQQSCATREMYIIDAYIKKEERKKKKKKEFSKLTLYLNKLEKEQTKPKARRKKKIRKIKAEINKIIESTKPRVIEKDQQN